MIADLDVVLPGRVSAEAEESATAMREFDTRQGSEIAPFAAILLRSESASSSQIEQLSASARKIAEAELTGASTGHAGAIVGNVRAMTAALALADNVDAGAILAMHDALMHQTAPEIASRWRTDQVWIGGRAVFGMGSPHDADFVPPIAHRVPELIADLVSFSVRADVPGVAQAAISHAQFETIHPLPDGNGRTGRAFLHAMLRARGIARQVSVPISSGLLADTQGYFDALTAYRDGDISPIVSCVSRAALIGVDNGTRLLADLDDVRQRWRDQLTGLRSDSAARRLAEGLFLHPVISAPVAREILGIGKNEHRYIDVLLDRGILRQDQDHKARNLTWRAQDVLDALDAYARRTGRRS